MMVCNVDSKFIKTSSYNLYQNILFKFSSVYKKVAEEVT